MEVLGPKCNERSSTLIDRMAPPSFEENWGGFAWRRLRAVQVHPGLTVLGVSCISNSPQKRHPERSASQIYRVI